MTNGELEQYYYEAYLVAWRLYVRSGFIPSLKRLPDYLDSCRLAAEEVRRICGKDRTVSTEEFAVAKDIIRLKGEVVKLRDDANLRRKQIDVTRERLVRDLNGR